MSEKTIFIDLYDPLPVRSFSQISIKQFMYDEEVGKWKFTVSKRKGAGDLENVDYEFLLTHNAHTNAFGRWTHLVHCKTQPWLGTYLLWRRVKKEKPVKNWQMAHEG